MEIFNDKFCGNNEYNKHPFNVHPCFAASVYEMSTWLLQYFMINERFTKTTKLGKLVKKWKVIIEEYVKKN